MENNFNFNGNVYKMVVSAPGTGRMIQSVNIAFRKYTEEKEVMPGVYVEEIRGENIDALKAEINAIMSTGGRDYDKR